ncbi:MAG: transketolase C-terminal domain-containing protein [bacterium]|nr:transketolase C-terminal domain-containing protein [bacterium]
MSKRILKYTEALREAADQLLEKDPSVFVVGLGVSYKDGADGTTSGLAMKYPKRVLDVPVSENAFTGMAVGAALSGLRPIVHHGRVEFSMLAMDPIITQAAKWNYMFGGGNPVPITLRIAVGRQWGNGPQHTQSLYGLFGGTPGLKVVIPSTPRMAKGLLISAVRDNNPVIILESRWLYKVKQDVPEKMWGEPLDKAKVLKKGTSITVVAYGDGLVSALEAYDLVGKSASIELIDVVSINPIDYETITKSVAKTGRLLCVDTAPGAFSVGSEIIATVAKSIKFKELPLSISTPAVPCPTSTALTESYYPTKVDIANAVLRAVKKPDIKRVLTFEELHLAPSLTLS